MSGNFFSSYRDGYAQGATIAAGLNKAGTWAQNYRTHRKNEYYQDLATQRSIITNLRIYAEENHPGGVDGMAAEHPWYREKMYDVSQNRALQKAVMYDIQDA